MTRPFTLFFLFFPMLGVAQADFGVKAGLNVSDIVMTNYINPDVESELRLKVGVHAGVFIAGMVDERVGIVAELLYSNKGVRANGNINLHYINAPLLLQYRLSERLFAEIGPELGYMIAATSDYGSAANTYNNKFDVGINGGLRVGGERINAGLRYCAGMFSVREPIEFTGSSGSEKIKFQNRTLQMYIGYTLWTLQ